MPAITTTVYSIDQKVLGIKKEATRGTVETTGFAYYPVSKETDFQYNLNHINDENVRGVSGNMPPYAGALDGIGRIPGFDVSPHNCGELFASLFGKVTTTGSTNYTHTMVKRSFGDSSPGFNNHQSNSFNVRRGLDDKNYNLGVTKSCTLTCAMDGILKADWEVLFQQESADAATPSITWTVPTPYIFGNGAFTFDSTQSYYVSGWSVTLDNGARIHRTLSGQQYCYDILTEPMMKVTGTVNLIFSDATARTAFLANTSTKFIIAFTKDANTSLTLTIYAVKYLSCEYANLNGLLGANIGFEAFYSIADTDTVQLVLKNQTATY